MEIWESPDSRSEIYLVPPKDTITVHWDDILACFYAQADEVFRAVDSRDIEEGDDDGASALVLTLRAFWCLLYPL